LATKTSASVLLERAFKIRFGLKLCLFTLAGGAALVCLLYLSLSKNLGDDYATAIYTIYDLKIRLLPLVFASFYTVVILGLVTVSIAAISLFFSHRIAGPIFRMEKNLEAIASGDLTVNTRFRGSDQLRVLGEEMNAMVRSLNHAARSASDSLEALRKAEEALKTLLAMDAPPEDELSAAVESLRAAVEGVRRAASIVRVRQ